MNDYLQILRPLTIFQAVGAFLVGRMVSLSSIIENRNFNLRSLLLELLWASSSIYLSYGAGMAMNDIVDAKLDAMHDDANKNDRPIASGRVSRFQGWLYCSMLSCVSIFMANMATFHAVSPSIPSPAVISPALSPKYTPPFHLLILWTISNILIMLGYAFGLQNIFLIKNLLCGWLAISPLIGAAILGGNGGASFSNKNSKLYLLAAVGFPLQIAREILKDIEDVDVDRRYGKKQTLPLVIGIEKSKRFAYTLVFLIIAGMIITPYYWKMFESPFPIYPLSVLLGFRMCLQASKMSSISAGQKRLKKSIYVLLAGMLGALSFQK